MLRFVKCKTSCNVQISVHFFFAHWAIFWPKGFNVIDKINHATSVIKAFHGILSFLCQFWPFLAQIQGFWACFGPYWPILRVLFYFCNVFVPFLYFLPPPTYSNLPNKGAGHWSNMIVTIGNGYTWSKFGTMVSKRSIDVCLVKTLGTPIREFTLFLPAPRISNGIALSIGHLGCIT